MGAPGWRDAVSFNQVLSEARRAVAADSTSYEGFR